MNLRDPMWEGLSAICAHVCAWHHVGTRVCRAAQSEAVWLSTARGTEASSAGVLSCRCLHASFASELAVPSTLLILVSPTRCG